MPLYDYHCRTCLAWLPDQWFQLAGEAPRERPCDCGGTLEKMPGSPTVFPAWADRTPVDGVNNIFAGVRGMDGHDGKNRLKYKSKKVQIDLGR